MTMTKDEARAELAAITLEKNLYFASLDGSDPEKAVADWRAFLASIAPRLFAAMAVLRA
jgi:hypothetical protein